MGGFQLLPFYEACRALGLRHTLINDERTGAFAADAYARVTNRVGFCDATLGPGATNLATALVESLNAGTPLVAIVGDAQPRPRLEEHDAGGAADRDPAPRRQGADPRGEHAAHPRAAAPRASRSPRRAAPARWCSRCRRTWRMASTSSPPAEFEVPERVTRIPALRARPDAADVARAAAMVARAERPMLLVGGGVHLGAGYAACARLVEEQAIPLAHTISGKGALACSHPLNAGLFGRYDRIANDLIAESDLLLVAGCKLGEIATKRFALLPEGVPVIHLDVLAEEFGRTSRCDVALWGDIAAGLDDLSAALAGQRHDRAAWAASVVAAHGGVARGRARPAARARSARSTSRA